MNLPSAVKIVEVGPRDGLQNEQTVLSTELKIEFIKRLAETGLRTIEAGSFVSPKWVPQMQDSDEVYASLPKANNVSYPVLIPNVQGLERALNVGVTDIAVFTTASQTFSERNTGCSVKESLRRIEDIVRLAKASSLNIRGYLSCVWGCPYQGKVDVNASMHIAEHLFHQGVLEISLGDTIGVGTPLETIQILERISRRIPHKHLAVHFHDTYGQAIANIFAALQMGISIIDSSIGGLGGCPYAPRASGNVATEDVLYLLNGMNIEHGVNFEKALEVSRWISQILNKKTPSKVSIAYSN